MQSVFSWKRVLGYKIRTPGLAIVENEDNYSVILLSNGSSLSFFDSFVDALAFANYLGNYTFDYTNKKNKKFDFTVHPSYIDKIQLEWAIKEYCKGEPQLMTKINLSELDLTEKELRVAKLIIATRGKNKGLLRASKPKYVESNPETGLAIYVWRVIAFYCSEKSHHHCIPCSHDFHLPGRMFSKEFKEAKAWCDALVDKIVDSVPYEERYGVISWARAFGAY